MNSQKRSPYNRRQYQGKNLKVENHNNGPDLVQALTSYLTTGSVKLIPVRIIESSSQNHAEDINNK